MQSDVFEVRFPKTDLLGFFLPYSFFAAVCILMFVFELYLYLRIVFAAYLLIIGGMMVLATCMFSVRVEGSQCMVRTKLGKRYTFRVSEIEKVVCSKKNGPKLGPQFSLRIMTGTRELELDSKMKGFSEMAGYLLQKAECGELNAQATSKHCREELVRYRNQAYLKPQKAEH